MTQKISLIEVIVTICIMALLTSIALPVYWKVKGTATGVGCVSHLRNLGLAFGQYSADNRNRLPHHDDGTDVPPTGFVWYKKVLPYLMADDEEGSKYRQDIGFSNSETNLNKVIFSYKMNSRLEDYKGSKKFFSPVFRDISSINFPSKTVLIFDGRADKIPYSFQSYGPPTYVEARHNEKAGILFLDWTVKIVEGENDDKGYWKNGGGLIWDPDFDR